MDIQNISISKIYSLDTEPIDKVENRFWFNTIEKRLYRCINNTWQPVDDISISNKENVGIHFFEPNSYIKIYNEQLVELLNGNAFTINFFTDFDFHKTYSSSTWYPFCIGNFTGSSTITNRLYASVGADNRFRIYIGSNYKSYDISNLKSITKENWNAISIVFYKTGDLNFYINGNLITPTNSSITTQTSFPTTTPAIYINAGYDNQLTIEYVSYYNIMVFDSDISIENEAYSIKNFANNDILYPNVNPKIQLANIRNSSDTIIPDLSGNNFSATIVKGTVLSSTPIYQPYLDTYKEKQGTSSKDITITSTQSGNNSGSILITTPSINTAGSSIGDIILTAGSGQAGGDETGSGNIILKTDDGNASTGNIELKTGNTTTGGYNSGTISLTTGNCMTSQGGEITITGGEEMEGGDININAGDAHTGGNINITSGQGTYTSGNINLIANSSSTSSGGNINLKINDSTDGTAGNITLISGSSSSEDGGKITLTAGETTGNYQAFGSNITLNGGNASTGAGGGVEIKGADGTAGSTGGNIKIKGGNADQSDGGNITIEGGGASVGGNIDITGGGTWVDGGSINISGGNGGTGSRGDVNLTGNNIRFNGNTITGELIDTSISSSSTNTHLPTSKAVYNSLNSKANDSDVVKLTGDQTISGIKEFETIRINPNYFYEPTILGYEIVNGGGLLTGSLTVGKLQNEFLEFNSSGIVGNSDLSFKTTQIYSGEKGSNITISAGDTVSQDKQGGTISILAGDNTSSGTIGANIILEGASYTKGGNIILKTSEGIATGNIDIITESSEFGGGGNITLSAGGCSDSDTSLPGNIIIKTEEGSYPGDITISTGNRSTTKPATYNDNYGKITLQTGSYSTSDPSSGTNAGGCKIEMFPGEGAQGGIIKLTPGHGSPDGYINLNGDVQFNGYSISGTLIDSSVSASSTNNHLPTSKAVYDAITKTEITTLTSGESISLNSNTFNKLTTNQDFSFTLPSITDNNSVYQIVVYLNITSSDAISINWGTTHFFNNSIPTIEGNSNYNVIYEYDCINSYWVCGVIQKS